MTDLFANRRRLDRLIELAIEEDLPGRDVTTAALIPAGKCAAGVIVAREEIVASGIDIARRVFFLVDETLSFEALAAAGETVAGGGSLARVSGSAAGILAGERTALNFLQRLCGVATFTRRVVSHVDGLPCLVTDTRKTTPGWRLLEKAAVRDGGGSNHRFSLSDGVLIKDNHLALCDGGVSGALSRVRAALPPGMGVEIEVTTLDELREAVDGGADVVMLDNFTVEDLERAVAFAGGRVRLEASGGVTPETVRAVAATGVQIVSMGALTHSAPAVDLSLEIEVRP